MKKLFLALIVVLLTASFAYAEIDAQTFSPNVTQNYREQQVFVDCVNNTGSAISSNYVVVIDTSSSTTASSANLGTYIATTTTANNPLVMGVTDQTIANGSVGRVCVRGPHKCYLSGLTGAAAGATLATTTTAGAAGMSGSTTKGGNFAVLLSTGVIQSAGAIVNSGAMDSTHTGDGFQAGIDGANNYWIWVGGVGAN